MRTVPRTPISCPGTNESAGVVCVAITGWKPSSHGVWEKLATAYEYVTGSGFPCEAALISCLPGTSATPEKLTVTVAGIADGAKRRSASSIYSVIFATSMSLSSDGAAVTTTFTGGASASDCVEVEAQAA